MSMYRRPREVFALLVHGSSMQLDSLPRSFALAASLIALTSCTPGDEGDDEGGESPIGIDAARQLGVDETATISGYVTVAPGTFNSAMGDQGFAIQDDAAGIYVSVPTLLDFDLGAHVTVTGSIAQIAQLTTLVADVADVVVEDGTMDIAPRMVATGEVNETSEGELIEIFGTVTQAVADDSPYGYKVYVDDGSGEIQVFVHIVEGQPVVELGLFEIDAPVSVIGFSAQYEDTYEIAPRMTGDVEAGA